MDTNIDIQEHTCATHGCGVTFWVSKQYGGRRRDDLLEFFCPNGHSLIYKGETDAAKLARITLQKDKEIVRLERELNSAKRKKRMA